MIRFVSACALSALLASFLLADEKKPVTLDVVLSQHRRQLPEPIWSPDGKQFAIASADSVALYDAATGKSKAWFDPTRLSRMAQHPPQSTTYDWQNRRVSSNSYQWSKDGKELLATIDGDLFLVHLNGKVTQLTHTPEAEEDAKLSPDAAHLLYRTSANLFLLTLKGKKITQLTNDGSSTLLNGQLDWVYPEELDLSTATWWSPDSKKIAYMQFNVAREFIYPQADLLDERAVAEPERYPQAGTPNAQIRVGVIDIESGQTTWLDLGSTDQTLLARIIWMPDSTTVAVERLSRLQDRLELLFCDAKTGRTHRILEERSKDWINFTDNFFPLQTRNEFLWTSESSGFRHLYRYSDRGEMLKQITSGEWEVRRIAAIDEAHQQIFYASSEASPLETQLYSVGFDGGARTRITPEPGSHQIRANQDCSAFVDTFSSITEPLQAVLKNGSGDKVAVLTPQDKSPVETHIFLPNEILKLKASDGTDLYGRLIKPLHFEPGTRYPLIMDVYGGPGVQNVRNSWYGLGWDQMMAQKGYMVFTLDNRGSSGRGHAFESPVFRDLGTTEVADQKTGVEYLIKQGLVDPNRIGITGWSYGGFMTLHCLLYAPDVFKVGVAGAPVTDWHNYDTIYTERYMGLPERNAEEYNRTSNVQNAAKLQGKLLIQHNFEDDNVLFQNTMQMANALESAGKLFFMQIYPQKTHGVSGELRRPLLQTSTDFFDQHLKPVQVLQ